LDRFQRLFTYVRQFYHQEKPRHLSAPHLSSIQVIGHEQYAAMNPQQIQSLLRQKHILVTGCPTSGISFDIKGLRTLAPLDVPIDIQGLPIIFFFQNHEKNLIIIE